MSHANIFVCYVAKQPCQDVLVGSEVETFPNDLQHLKMLVSFGSVCVCV